MPRNGVRTVSPGLLHRSMHRSITSSCSGEIWRSSSLSRPPRYCSVRDWFMSIQTGDAYRCQTSIEYQLRPSVDVVNFDGSGPSPSPCNSSKHPLTGSAFSPGLRNVKMRSEESRVGKEWVRTGRSRGEAEQ